MAVFSSLSLFLRLSIILLLNSSFIILYTSSKLLSISFMLLCTISYMLLRISSFFINSFDLQSIYLRYPFQHYFLFSYLLFVSISVTWPYIVLFTLLSCCYLRLVAVYALMVLWRWSVCRPPVCWSVLLVLARPRCLLLPVLLASSQPGCYLVLDQDPYCCPGFPQ